MYSKEQLNEFAKDFLMPRLDRNIKKIQQTVALESIMIKKELLSCVDNLLKKCISQQREETKQPIRYLHFFYLRLAVITQQYDIQINVFSEQSYMDQIETMMLWKPDFIMNYYRDDIEAIEQEARNQVLHFGYPQLMELREKCFAIYIVLIGQYLMSVIEDITSLASFQEMKKADDMQIVFGGYMDKGMQIWSLADQKERY